VPILGGGKSSGPYELADCEKLSLPNLSNLLTSGRVCEKRGEQPTLRIAIIGGSGRYRTPGPAQSVRQAGLISDFLYIPELVHSLVSLSCEHRPKLTLDLSSFLDIDLTAHPSGNGIKHDYNLITCGSGAVNSVTAQVLAEFSEAPNELKVSFMSPNSQTIVGIDQHDKMVRYGVAHKNLGILSLSTNPWSEGQRIVLICAGIEAVGTTTAIFALNRCIEDPGSIENNIYDQNVSAKIVSGELCSYDEKMMWPVDYMMPPLDVRSIERKAHAPFRILQ
jgi:hypothetical protein